MKIIEADHKQYIRLGDLYHLLHLMRWDMVYDKYDRDEDGAFIQKDGTKGLTIDDARIVSALSNVMTRILHNKVHACETPDEIRKLYNTPYIENWAGKKITMYVKQVRAFGDVTDAVRIRDKVKTEKVPDIKCEACGKTIKGMGQYGPEFVANKNKER